MLRRSRSKSDFPKIRVIGVIRGQISGLVILNEVKDLSLA